MKKLLFFALLIGVLTVSAGDKGHRLVSVAFYNLENLFDTLHDEGKNDVDFLPEGSYKWTSTKYEAKLKNMAQVIGSLARERTPLGPAFVGVAEVENRRVLEDLTAQPAISKYKFIHHEGPDKRGIDCALLYDPEQFVVSRDTLILSKPYQGDTTHPTRGFLLVDGKLYGERVCVIVNHWPSRGADSPVRVHAARQVRAIADSLRKANKKVKLIIMGDLNDDPMDESMQTLGARKQTSEVEKGEFYNPWWSTLEDEGVGTLMYRGKWNLFDQIVLSRSLIKGKKGWHYNSSEVFKRDYLIQQDGQYAGSPLRTHGGRAWLNGYSDHLPTIVYLEK